MQSNKLTKLKISLNDVISEWLQNADEENWKELNTYVSDNVTELMTDAAFTILLAQSDLTRFLTEQGFMKEEE